MGNAARDSARVAVVTAARKLFVENGYDRTSMDDIAREVGVSKPSIYDLYAGKEALLVAVMFSAVSLLEKSLTETVSTSELPFSDFVDILFGEAETVADSSERFSMFQLLIAEGPHSSKIAETYLKLVREEWFTKWQAYFLSAMENGECRKMDPMIVHRTLISPIMYVALDKVLFKEAAMSAKMRAQFLSQAKDQIKASLVVKPD